jgi:predicted alpha/beta-fold hydrolase
MKSTFPLSLGKEGSLNDFSAHSVFPIDKLDEITVPTLILHSKNVEMAPYSEILPVSEKIPGVKLKVFETGGHLFLIPH